MKTTTKKKMTLSSNRCYKTSIVNVPTHNAGIEITSVLGTPIRNRSLKSGISEPRQISYRKYQYLNRLGQGKPIPQPHFHYSRYGEETWLLKYVRVLEKLRNLSQNWDSYGAEPPNLVALYWAKTALEILFSMGFQPDRVTPSVENGVGISFIRGKKYADIECFNTGEILAVVSNGQGNPLVWEVDNNPAGIKGALRKIRDFIRS